MKYGVDDTPPWGALSLYGLQWFAVMLPIMLIMGAVLGRLHFSGIGQQVWYLQKIFVLTGVTTVVQILFGHRLPVVEGPATVLMVGVTASAAVGYDATYTAMLTGGLALTLAAATGVLSRIRVLFTRRVVAVILLLVPLTLAPTILRLSLPPEGDRPLFNLVFLLALVAATMVVERSLTGVWKSLAVLVGLAGGSLAYFLLWGFPETAFMASPSTPFPLFLERFDFHAGAIASFLICYLGLAINQVGSIEAIGLVTKAGDMDARMRNGQLLEGVMNAGSGLAGVLGPVSYSLSAGIVTATGCASRFTLLPAAGAVIACGLFPGAVHFLSLVPGVVMGGMLLYVMAAQFASGLMPLAREDTVADFGGGLTIGFALMVGLLFSILPQEAADAIPALLRPLIANGFIMGTATVLVLEHGLIRAGK